MKKIAILTYWGVPNYGAWVQAYALNNVLRKLVNGDVEVIHLNYLNKRHWDMYYKDDERLYNSFSYSWDEIPHSQKINEEELENLVFDVVVTGSDSIWEFSVPEMGNDKHLIGNNLNTDKLISYAASFGITTEKDVQESWVWEGLGRYDKILLRDEHSKEVVEKIDNQLTAKIVVDPALLWNFKDDEKIKLPRYENYFVVYGVQFDEEFKKNVIELAKEKKCKLISVGFVNDWCDMSLKMIELRTLEWLGMFKKSTYVITSTFHGLMVGLSFEKQIKFDQVEYVKNRSQTLVEELKIPNHCENFYEEIDYQYASRKLENLRNESIKCLVEALEE